MSSTNTANEPMVDLMIDAFRQQLEAWLPSLSDRLVPVGKNLLKRNAAQLQTWVSLAAAGQLTKDEVAWLVRSRMDLTRLTALESAGLAQVEIDQFRNMLTKATIGVLIGRLTGQDG